MDCAETAGNPAASSSVSDARKTFSTVPKRASRRLQRVGPSCGVRLSASHSRSQAEIAEAEEDIFTPKSATVWGFRRHRQGRASHAGRRLRLLWPEAR